MNNKRKCYYISSKMSGLPNYNFVGFKKKKLELLYMFNGQIEVYNPAEHEPDKKDVIWAEYLAQDLIDIETKTTTIYMWGKWYRSQGSWVELLTAHRLGKEIIIESRWLKWIPKVLNLLFTVSGSSKSTLTEG